MKGIITETELKKYKELKEKHWLINTDHPEGPKAGTAYITWKCSTVVFYLDKLYPHNIKTISSLVFKNKRNKKKKIIVKYNQHTYDINCQDNWFQHPIYQEYKDVVKEYKTKQQNKTNNTLLELNKPIEITPEVLRFIKTFAPNYQLDVNYDDPLELTIIYHQLQWYLDNNIDYCLDYHELAQGNIEPEFTPFSNYKFTNTNEHDKIDVETYGDLTYFDALTGTTDPQIEAIE